MCNLGCWHHILRGSWWFKWEIVILSSVGHNESFTFDMIWWYLILISSEKETTWVSTSEMLGIMLLIVFIEGSSSFCSPGKLDCFKMFQTYLLYKTIVQQISTDSVESLSVDEFDKFPRHGQQSERLSKRKSGCHSGCSPNIATVLAHTTNYVLVFWYT